MRFLNERGRSLLALWTLCTGGACDASVASELPPSGADGSASGSCASLGACCQSLPSEVVTSCTELAAEASALLPNARIINAYGTTEGGPVVFTGAAPGESGESRESGRSGMAGGPSAPAAGAAPSGSL